MDQPHRYFIRYACAARQIAVLASCFAGCAAETEQLAPDSDSAELATDTIMVIADDGSVLDEWTQSISQQARAAQIADRAQLEAQSGPTRAADGVAVVKESLLRVDCSDGGALWLFDQPNLAGARLCLVVGDPDAFLYDSIDLGTVRRRAGGSWAGAVRSLFAGGNAGLLYRCGPGTSPGSVACFTTPQPLSFGAWQARSSLPATSYNTVNLNLPE
jgi:hypothetical protein